jgi:hypothetical protein
VIFVLADDEDPDVDDDVAVAELAALLDELLLLTEQPASASAVTAASGRARSGRRLADDGIADMLSPLLLFIPFYDYFWVCLRG